jgi:hypothetical protein
LKFELAKHVHAKFQLFTFYPDGLRILVDIFSRKFKNFSKKHSEFRKNSNLSM